MNLMHSVIFRKINDNSILTVYLLHLNQDLTDKAFEIHDRQILISYQSRKAQEEIQKLNGKKLNEKVIHFTNMDKL